jgi:hypothetical protein
MNILAAHKKEIKLTNNCPCEGYTDRSN